MKYTILMFDGSAKHYDERVGKLIAAAKHNGDTCVSTPAGELIDCKAISNILPFKKWRMEEETKLNKKSKDMYICDFGQFHPNCENCRCASEGLEPCTTEAARLLAEPQVKLSEVPVLDSDRQLIETL